jgi:hypothetical protein
MKRIIHIGDGRHIEITEGELRKPPPEIKQKRASRYPRFATGKVPKKEPAYAANGGLKKKVAEIPGYKEWLGLRKRQTYGLSGEMGRITGQQPGVTKVETLRLREIARKQVEKDMANIKKSGVDLSEAAEEALKETITIMREAGDARFKLSAARQVLEWTKAKPASSSNLTVNAAEDWLSSLATDDNDEDDTEGAT